MPYYQECPDINEGNCPSGPGGDSGKTCYGGGNNWGCPAGCYKPSDHHYGYTYPACFAPGGIFGSKCVPKEAAVWAVTGPPPTVTNDTVPWPANTTFPSEPYSLPGCGGSTTNGTAPPTLHECHPNAMGKCGPGVCKACCSKYISDGAACEQCVADQCPTPPPAKAGVFVDENPGSAGYPIAYVLLCRKT